MRPPVLWTGKLTRAMTLLVNISNAAAVVNGNVRGISAMKERVRRGYDGEFSEDVSRYDALGLELQARAARLQLHSVDIRGKDVLDVGCGTGVLTFLALEMGAASVTCGDISRGMLAAARDKADAQGYGSDRVTFRELDAESLPFPSESFDVALTGMTLGLLPHQQAAVSELARVTRRGGLVCVGAHGPEHYWEAIDASLRAIDKRRVFGYRLEFWPRTDTEVEAMLDPRRADGCDDDSSRLAERLPERRRRARLLRRRERDVVVREVPARGGRRSDRPVAPVSRG